jgi:amidohydrolase
MTAASDPKRHAQDSVMQNAGALIALSHRVHGRPELGFEETASSAWVAGVLSDAGLAVDVGIHDLATAFRCTVGDGPLHLAICAEYDALPGIGHACGHNIIAAIAVGAGLALAPLADDLGLRISVIGTPAEELGGGKVLLLERGAFSGVHAAMMAHPTPYDDPTPRVSARECFAVRYHGHAAHAAAAPERGINAGDALTIAQAAIGLLRQHLRPHDQVHGIVHRGGDVPNVVPAFAEGSWIVRAETTEALHELRPRVERCFEAGALATGARLEIEEECPPYAEMVHDHELLGLYRENSTAIGRPMSAGGENTFSTDMGNVSRAVPSIHPCIAIDTAGAVNHQPEFAAACINASADRAVIEASLALAMTAIDIATGPAGSRLLAAGALA